MVIDPDKLIEELCHSPRQCCFWARRLLAPTDADNPVLTAAASAPVANFEEWWFRHAPTLEEKCERLNAAGRAPGPRTSA